MSDDNATPEVEVTTAEPQEKASSGRGRPKSDAVDYPVPEGGITVLPLSPPWVAGTHKMLKPSDFADDADYNEWKGNYYKTKGEKMLRMAVELRKLGDVETRKAAARLAKIKEESKKLLETLTAAGIDPEAALRAIMGE